MTPEFEEILEDGDPPERVAGWREVHDLLVSSTPPPTLRARVEQAPRPTAHARRSRLLAAFSLATVASVAAGLAVGYSIGHGGFQTAFTRPMHGLGAARAASAVIEVGHPGLGGNRTLEMTVRSLPAIPGGGWYGLYLTEKGKPVALCGAFQTGSSGSAQVEMNLPGDLGEYDGWNVTAHLPGQPARVLLTT